MFPDHLPLLLFSKHADLRDIHCLRLVNRRFHQECNVEFLREFKRRLNLVLQRDDVPLPINYFNGAVIMTGDFLADVLRDFFISIFVPRLVYPTLNAGTVDSIVTDDSSYIWSKYVTTCKLYYRGKYILLVRTSVHGEFFDVQYNGEVLTINRNPWYDVPE